MISFFLSSIFSLVPAVTTEGESLYLDCSQLVRGLSFPKGGAARRMHRTLSRASESPKSLTEKEFRVAEFLMQQAAAGNAHVNLVTNPNNLAKDTVVLRLSEKNPLVVAHLGLQKNRVRNQELSTQRDEVRKLLNGQETHLTDLIGRVQATFRDTSLEPAQRDALILTDLAEIQLTSDKIKDLYKKLEDIHFDQNVQTIPSHRAIQQWHSSNPEAMLLLFKRAGIYDAYKECKRTNRRPNLLWRTGRFALKSAVLSGAIAAGVWFGTPWASELGHRHISSQTFLNRPEAEQTMREDLALWALVTPWNETIAPILKKWGIEVKNGITEFLP